MWPLLIISITSLACIFERLTYWKSSLIRMDSELFEIIERYSIINSLNNSDKLKKYPMSLEKVLSDTLKIIDQSYLEEKSNIDIKLALEISVQSIQSEFGRFSNLFSTIITVSPLLGLLGTVIGLIESFAFITIGQYGINAKEVTGGISEALISTASGLIIAIITLIFSNYFNSLWRKQNSLLNEFCSRFELLYRKSILLNNEK